MARSRYSCMLSALMITPRSASARRNASADLPLAVGPATMIRAVIDRLLAWAGWFEDSPRHGPCRMPDRRSEAGAARLRNRCRRAAGDRWRRALAGGGRGLRAAGRR